MTHHVKTRTCRDEDKYFKDRIEYKINSYSQHADRHKWLYWCLASVAALGSIAVPALINIGDVPNLVPTIVSASVALLVAVDRILVPMDHWRNYDLMSASLREEEMRYSTCAEPYNESRTPFLDLVDRVEALIARERRATILARTRGPGEDGGADENPA